MVLSLKIDEEVWQYWRILFPLRIPGPWKKVG